MSVRRLAENQPDSFAFSMETMEQVPPPSRSYLVPSQPRSFTTLQPKKSDGAPDFKCPTREELMKPICEIGIDIAVTKGDVPKECPMLADGGATRVEIDLRRPADIGTVGIE